MKNSEALGLACSMFLCQTGQQQGRAEFICEALSLACREGHIPSDQRNFIRNFIRCQIRPHYLLAGFLDAKREFPRSAISSDGYYNFRHPDYIKLRDAFIVLIKKELDNVQIR